MATTIPNPNFPVITEAIWSQETPIEITTQIVLKIRELQNEGKTDGLFDIPDMQPPFHAYRNWVDVDAANAWVAWLQSIGGPTLASIQVLP